MDGLADLAGIPPELLGFVLSDPERAAIEIDRYLVEQGGLRTFSPLAWPAVEAEGRFVGNWHIDAIADHLMAVSEGHIQRLMMAIPPRHMKSLKVAVFWPCWDWIKRPDRRFLFSSYAQTLSVRDSTKCRRIIQSPWYRSRWGDRFKLVDDQNQKQRFENDKHGYRLSTSVDGALTGEGGDIIVVDDPHNVRQGESEKVREETLKWFDEALSTRLNDPKTGAYVVIQQRVHERDLVGHILSKRDQVKPWTYLCLPAEYDPKHKYVWVNDPRKEPGELLWPEHMPSLEIASKKVDLGPYAYAAQYQQSPAPREGGLFKRAWFSIVAAAPADTRWIRAWDLAASEAKATKSDPDWTATVKLGFSPSAKRFFIAHVFRCRENPHEVRQMITQFAEADGKMVRQVVPQDPGQAGKDQAQQMALMLAGWPVVIELPTGDKWTRAQGLAAQAAAGNVSLIQGDWNATFLDELTGFPTGAHDDMVDAASSAFNRISGGSTGLLDWMREQSAAGDAAREAEKKLQESVKRDGVVKIEAEATDQSFTALRDAMLKQFGGS